MATFSSGAGPYTLILNANEVSGSANVGSNTSKVSWSLQMRADSAYCQWNPGPGDFEVRINGGLVWSAQNPSLWYGGMGGTLTLASGTTTVGHNSDGSKTVYCEGKYIANSTANYLPNSSTCGGNLTLSTIPRASSFSSISGNTIGGSQTININRKSSSFTHSLWYKIGNGGWVGIDSGIGTSKTWTLPTSLNNQIPNSTSLTLTYILRTYNGSTQIGSDVYYNYTVYYSGNNPNAGSVAITYANLFNGKFIANHSTATIKHTGYGGVYGSSIKSAQIIFNGGWKGTTNYNTGKLTAGTHTFQGVVTDSRDKTVYTSQQSFTCYQINNPTVSINAYRSDAEGNASPSGTYITIIPTYSAHDPVGGNNIKSNSFTCTSLMTTGTAISSGSKKILSNAAVDSEYVISGTVTDQLGRSSATSIKVGTAFTILDIRPDEKGMAFGKYSTGANKFEVAWDAYFDKDLQVNGDIYQSASSCSESTLGSVPIAGTAADMTLGDIRKYKSGLYTAVVDGDWKYLWVNKHRNGAGDGNNYNNYIMQSFWDDNMYHGRVNDSGEVQSKYQFLDDRHWNNIMAGNTNVVVKSALLNLIYPIGSVYFSRSTGPADKATCPIKSTLGGTWQLIEVSMHTNYNTGFAIDISGGIFQNSQNAQLYQCNGGRAQRFIPGLWNFGSARPTTPDNNVWDPTRSSGGQGWLCIWVRTA